MTSDRGRSRASANSRKPSRLCGRNSCRGGSNRRMQTGRPCMMLNNCTKSARCIGNRRDRAAARSCGVPAKIISRITTRRSSSKNMCSVRHKPMPCASNCRAVMASAGVSALARTPMSRTPSAHDRSLRKASSRAAASRTALPASTSPVVPSIVIWSPSTSTRPSATVIFLSFASNRRPDAPTTQGTPKPRAITAAWLVMPPRSVSTPAAEFMPRISSGSVSRRHRIHASPRAAWACAAAEENTIRPVAAPGEAAIPLASTSRGARGSTWGCNSSVRLRGSTRKMASFWLMMPSSAKATAMRRPARAERGTLTASITDSLPSSMVNSICISSRSLMRQAAP